MGMFVWGSACLGSVCVVGCLSVRVSVWGVGVAEYMCGRGSAGAVGCLSGRVGAPVWWGVCLGECMSGSVCVGECLCGRVSVWRECLYGRVSVWEGVCLGCGCVG